MLSSQIGIHKNGIVQVLIVHKENIFFTIGLDQQLMWFEMTAGNKQLAVLKNPQKCCYTHLVWDDLYDELYAADEKGFIYIINVY